ncbi:unnamed protein product [Ceratitis capitata]|uniref:(Mediterranean fruit fly) hypothetical protein n=1 Tax=Ceratitis capitata TaxID=7213 RepID=A0A811UN81_CERCA|nr:unnamed protein product [Ceratitis capitata]
MEQQECLFATMSSATQRHVKIVTISPDIILSADKKPTLNLFNVQSWNESMSGDIGSNWGYFSLYCINRLKLMEKVISRSPLYLLWIPIVSASFAYQMFFSNNNDKAFALNKKNEENIPKDHHDNRLCHCFILKKELNLIWSRPKRSRFHAKAKVKCKKRRAAQRECTSNDRRKRTVKAKRHAEARAAGGKQAPRYGLEHFSATKNTTKAAGKRGEEDRGAEHKKQASTTTNTTNRSRTETSLKIAVNCNGAQRLHKRCKRGGRQTTNDTQRQGRQGDRATERQAKMWNSQVASCCYTNRPQLIPLCGVRVCLEAGNGGREKMQTEVQIKEMKKELLLGSMIKDHDEER